MDRVLYLVGGQFLVGPPDEVMTTETLSKLYGSDIEVIRVGGRLLVVGGEDGHHCMATRTPTVPRERAAGRIPGRAAPVLGLLADRRPPATRLRAPVAAGAGAGRADGRGSGRW